MDANDADELRSWLDKVAVPALREFVQSPQDGESKASLINRIMENDESINHALYSKRVEESVGFVR